MVTRIALFLIALLNIALAVVTDLTPIQCAFSIAISGVLFIEGIYAMTRKADS